MGSADPSIAFVSLDADIGSACYSQCYWKALSGVGCGGDDFVLQDIETKFTDSLYVGDIDEFSASSSIESPEHEAEESKFIHHAEGSPDISISEFLPHLHDESNLNGSSESTFPRCKHAGLPVDGVLDGCAASMSLPVLRSALKGGRAHQGIVLDCKLTVKWAPDVYDPPVTSESHTVKGGYRYRSKTSRKDYNKHKHSKSHSKSKGSRSKSERKHTSHHTYSNSRMPALRVPGDHSEAMIVPDKPDLADAESGEDIFHHLQGGPVKTKRSDPVVNGRDLKCRIGCSVDAIAAAFHRPLEAS